MQTRSVRFSLLAVSAVSVVFGIVIGGFLNSPEVAVAAPGAIQPTANMAPAITANSGVRDFADVVDQSMDSIVSVTSRDDRDEDEEGGSSDPQDLFRFFFGDPQDEPQTPQRPRIGEGTGFVISTDGYILTNYHVVQNADRVKVGFRDGGEETAEVVGTDPSIDLALLKIAVNGLTPLPLGDSESLRVGEWVIAIGNPLDFEQTVTVGVLSAKNRRVPLPTLDRRGLVTFLQTDAAINFGNSGGPLLDIDGNVVGINTAIARQNLAEGIGFALPINQARRVIDQLRDFGEVKRGYIGINMNTTGIDRDAQEYLGLPDRNGVIIDAVTPGSPAERAGLRPFDVIREVNGELIEGNDQLITKISSYMPGERVELEIFRDGKGLTKSATLGERPLQNEPQPAVGVDTPEDEPQESEGLGITVQALDRRVREQFELSSSLRGVLITDVEFDSQAAEKGVLPLRIVTHVNGEEIDSVEAWDAAIRRLRPGQPVKIDVVVPVPNGGQQTFFLRAP
ncbi:MAG: PDZ domain-containing protein [Acidobacteria bacterium]|nr:PDZ domain-containing protein [Acidobacteriota bacterium]NIM60243.1 PDZ domain-containing protein [Acidobacteriota bacterium]NIO60281.1 PDZ domain-containing protein [Acidobacteriota bacterium]NIQ31336.1 PDZ domain-containing protein [Acidobacteriota bacterium]NIQ86559.1 PDZ domain-containing protein [Acidobacteriota bacterium]